MNKKEQLIREVELRKSIVLSFTDDRDDIVITEGKTVVRIATDYRDDFSGLVVDINSSYIHLYGESYIRWEDIKDINIVTIKKIGE